MAGGLAGAVMTAYDTLVQKLSEEGECANKGAVKLNKPITACFNVNQNNNKVTEFEVYMHFVEWMSNNEKIGILLHAREAINRPNNTIIKSTIKVDYYTIEGKTSLHRHSIHFDFDSATLCHPLFHAQVCTDWIALPDGMGEEIGFRYVREPTQSRCFREARIPTSDMTLPSVLLCLAADMLAPQFFTSYLESVCKIQQRMPLPAHNQTQLSINNAAVAHLRSSHWFAHHHTVHVK